jgi:hypothetical protein
MVYAVVGVNARDAQGTGRCVICGRRYSEGQRVADLPGSADVCHVSCLGGR